MTHSDSHSESTKIKKYSDAQRPEAYKAARQKILDEIGQTAEYIEDHLPPSWHVEKESGRITCGKPSEDGEGYTELVYDRMAATVGIDSSIHDKIASFTSTTKSDEFSIVIQADGAVTVKAPQMDVAGKEWNVSRELIRAEDVDIAHDALALAIGEIHPHA
jgi:hypothetical protein